MHYYVDGYNLLFYLFGTGKNELRSQRDQLIQSLNIKVESLALDLSIVFDSHLCPGEASRNHYHHLEVLYSAEGVTADDFIIQLIAGTKNPTQEVVVTNDRELAMRAKHHYASTQNIENFLNWLNRRYSNQTKRKVKPLAAGQGKSKKHVPEATKASIAKKATETTTPIKLEPPRPRIKLIPLPEPIQIPVPIEEDPKNAPGSFDFYLSQFQTEHEKILEKEKLIKQEKKPEHKREKHKRKEKRLSSLFEEPTQKSPPLSDEERWLKIFEERDKKV